MKMAMSDTAGVGMGRGVDDGRRSDFLRIGFMRCMSGMTGLLLLDRCRCGS